jgi:cardiolipin synthase
MVPALVGAFFLEDHLSNWVALGIFIVAAMTDFFDGYLARALQSWSELGRMLDPIADKLLVAVALVMLIYAHDLSIPSLLAAIVILCREILVSGLREYLGGLSVSMPVSKLAKWKTAVQMIAIGFLLAGEPAEQILPGTMMVGAAGLWLAALLTLYTGYDYFRAGLRHMQTASPT